MDNIYLKTMPHQIELRGPTREVKLPGRDIITVHAVAYSDPVPMGSLVIVWDKHTADYAHRRERPYKAPNGKWYGSLATAVQSIVKG
jgi:hypothetical protein